MRAILFGALDIDGTKSLTGVQAGKNSTLITQGVTYSIDTPFESHINRTENKWVIL